jgi:hypothetical protein
MLNAFLIQLFGNDYENILGLTKFSSANKELIGKKIQERLQAVILETAVAKMSEEQFQNFQKIVENTTDPDQAQQQIASLAQQMPELGAALKENIAREIEALKQIINAPK